MTPVERMKRLATPIAGYVGLVVVGVLFLGCLYVGQRLGFSQKLLTEASVPMTANSVLPALALVVGYMGGTIALLVMAWASVYQLRELRAERADWHKVPAGYYLTHQFEELVTSASFRPTAEQRHAAARQLIDFARGYVEGGSVQNAVALLYAVASHFEKSGDTTLRDIGREASELARRLVEPRRQTSGP